ncbi:hypothetical protein TNIN_166771 [Trichonephila inaurata madagascariensis]|uniref:Uncharacterized protein n=1 Tax=Trichonephila inaurata madagascariensis TaxID=2747483 RepID=A0A8X7BX00_9ARAC|nr:hypothetical protein TNIN_166771 [Trichonephila inaurata madagascariensis]
MLVSIVFEPNSETKVLQLKTNVIKSKGLQNVYLMRQYKATKQTYGHCIPCLQSSIGKNSFNLLSSYRTRLLLISEKLLPQTNHDFHYIKRLNIHVPGETRPRTIPLQPLLEDPNIVLAGLWCAECFHRISCVLSHLQKVQLIN